VEPELARLAAEKRYPEDIAHLRQVLDDLDAMIETGSYNDFAVHRAIARAARNPILERALGDALAHTDTPLWLGLQERALELSQTREGASHGAHQVVRCIEEGRSAEAAKVWRQHLVFFRDEMLRRI